MGEGSPTPAMIMDLFPLGEDGSAEYVVDAVAVGVVKQRSGSDAGEVAFVYELRCAVGGMRCGRCGTGGSGTASGSGPRLDGIALGKDLATSLAVRPGDVVTVLTPEGTLTPMGVMPRARSLRVVGIFSLGLYEMDSAYAVVSLPVGLRLMGKGYPDYIQLKVDDLYQAHAVAESIVAAHGAAYQVQDFAQMNQSLFSALQLEKMAVSITIGLIVMVAALNIVASLVLMVMEKSRDIAILKTMGATRRSISIVFMLQGTLIGLVGTLAGVALGLGLSFVLDRYRLVRIPTDVYQISYVPFRIEPFAVAVVAGAALLICFLATIYPSRQASRLDPAEALRHG